MFVGCGGEGERGWQRLAVEVKKLVSICTHRHRHNRRYLLMNKCSIINSHHCAAAATTWTKLISTATEPERKLKHCTKSIKQINYTKNLAQHWIDCAKWNYEILHSIRASLLLKMACRLVRYRSRCRSFILTLLVHTFVLARTDLLPGSSERAHLALLFSCFAILSVFISVINFANFITLVKQPASQSASYFCSFSSRRTLICNKMNSNCCFWSIIHLCYAFFTTFLLMYTSEVVHNVSHCNDVKCILYSIFISTTTCHAKTGMSHFPSFLPIGMHQI